MVLNQHNTLSYKRTYVIALGLIVASLCLELNSSASHDGGGEHVAVELVLVAEAEDVEGILSVLQLFVVVDGVNLRLALGDIDVVVDVIRETAHLFQPPLSDTVSIGLEKLVEDVVRPLNLLLLRDTGLLQKIRHNVATGQLST